MKLIPNLLPSNIPKGLRFERAEKSGTAAIYFKSDLYESYIEELGGVMDVLPDGYIHLYIFAEHYKEGGEIRTDLKSKLDKLLAGAPLVREYIVNSDGILLMRHFHSV